METNLRWIRTACGVEFTAFGARLGDNTVFMGRILSAIGC
jgi:hypothetical protein